MHFACAYTSDMLTAEQLRRMVSVIHSEPDYYGVLVGYQGNGQSIIVHNGVMPSVNFLRKFVIIEEAVVPPPRLTGPRPGQSGVQPTEAPPSPLRREATGALISCGLTAVAAFAMATSGAATVGTGGAAGFLFWLSIAGFATSVMQCTNAIMRTTMAAYRPSVLVADDNDQFLQHFWLVVDGIGVATSLASLPDSTRRILTILNQRGSLPAVEVFMRLPATERNELLASAFRGARQDAAVYTQIGRLLEQAVPNTVPMSVQMLGTVNQAVVHRLLLAIRDVTATAAGVVASGSPGDYTGAASGSVNFAANQIASFGQSMAPLPAARMPVTRQAPSPAVPSILVHVIHTTAGGQPITCG